MTAEQIYIKPKSIDEALEFAHQYNNNSRFIAGGTDLLVNKFQGNEEVNCLIDLTGIDELRAVEKVTFSKANSSLLPSAGAGLDFLRIGSLVKLDDLRNYPEIRNEFPVLIEAAEAVASPVLRKTATLGGNILCENRCIFYNQSAWWREAAGFCLKCDGDVCIATGGKKACFSKFISDTAPALISMNAEIEVRERKKTRIIKLGNIYSGDGVEPRILKRNEIISSILLPEGQDFKVCFKKLRQRDSMDFSSLTTCVSLSNKGRIRIVLGGVDPAPVVVDGSVKDDKKDMIKQAVKKSRIVDNDVFSRKYRKEMINVFLEKSFSELSI